MRVDLLLSFPLLQLFGVIDCRGLKTFQCHSICGREDGDATDGGGGGGGGGDTNRIVSGYKPSLKRPWMALIVQEGVLGQMESMCGGAVINRRYVMTAAHCICTEYPCSKKKKNKNGGRGMEPDPGFEDRFKIFLGLNERDVATKDKAGSPVYTAKSIVLHEGWINGEVLSSDLALIRTTKSIDFGSGGLVRPICLAANDDYDIVPDDPHKETFGFIAGWGLLWDKCSVDNSGPQKSAYCQMPFKFRGKTHDACVKGKPNPSSYNVLCQKYTEWLKVNGREKLGMDESVRLIYGKDGDKKTVTCFNPHAGKNGWCGTCVKTALSGEPGHCPPDEEEDEDDDDDDEQDQEQEKQEEKEEASTVPVREFQWGWCRNWCSRQDDVNLTERLMETKLSILTTAQCVKLTKNTTSSQMGFNKTLELCAGKKQPKPKVRTFKVVLEKESDGSKKSSRKIVVSITGNKNMAATAKEFKLDFREIENKKDEDDFFIGGTDSCTGDSGGPIWVWEKERAVAVGVVSRGDGCAKVRRN